tara:strand:+ start:527 stop:2356 length:1830 start_codon:yes stop_codon:yes gene_type:complete
MHFNLPDQLAIEVASYDKTRKKLAAAMAAEDKATGKKKQTYPCGRPSNMFPSDIVNDRTWSEVVDVINARTSKEKYHLLTKPVFGEEPKPFAIVYFIKQLWVACWLPRRKDDGYIYGITVAFRDTKAARNQCTERYFLCPNHLNKCMFNHTGGEEDMMPRIKEGRTHWYRKSIFFTQDELTDGYTNNYWKTVTSNHDVRSYGGTYNMSNSIRKWEQELVKDIPIFVNGSDGNCFTRMNPANCKFETIMSQYYSRPRWQPHGTDYVHDLDTIMKSLRNRFNGNKVCSRSGDMYDFFEAKWFRSLLAKAMANTYTIHEEQTASLKYNREALLQPYAELYQFIETVADIKHIYKDMDLNLIHSRYELLKQIDMPGQHSDIGDIWMRENLPVESLLNMFQTYYDKETKEDTYRRPDAKTGYIIIYMHLYRDTYQMLTQCMRSENTDNLKPKRWRLQDWHDHLMAESWKLQNPKVDLPQKLFPEPVQVRKYVDLTWDDCFDMLPQEEQELELEIKISFFQPKDTHQLAAWGRAVRNCVGGGHGYAEGVKRMKHLIVLAMVDGKPRYTVQLTVDNGIMNVDQIADIGNRRLDDIERSTVQEAFSYALQKRTQQLN